MSIPVELSCKIKSNGTNNLFILFIVCIPVMWKRPNMQQDHEDDNPDREHKPYALTAGRGVWKAIHLN